MIQEQAAPKGEHRRTRHRSWLRVLLIGLLLYVVGIIVLVLTGNRNLFPTVVMVGNFLVPVTFVVFFYERRELSQLNHCRRRSWGSSTGPAGHPGRDWSGGGETAHRGK